MQARTVDVDYARVAEWNFCRSYEDLHARAFTEPDNDRYRMLGIAPLLRKLLFDGTPLLHAANSRRRVKTEFRMRPFPYTQSQCLEQVRYTFVEAEEATGWRVFAPGDLLPRNGDSGESLSLPAFGNATVGYVSGYPVSVRQLVKFYCEVEGGVHIGKGRTRAEVDMLATVPAELVTPYFGLRHSPILTLQFVGILARNGLSVLYDAIMADPIDADHRGIEVKNVPGWQGLEP